MKYLFLILFSLSAYAVVEYQDTTFKKTVTIDGVATIRGGVVQTVKSIVAGTTLINSDHLVQADGTASMTVTLYTAVGNGGHFETFKNVDASGFPLIIDANGAETIENQLTITLVGRDDTATIYSDNSNWRILDRNFKKTFLAATSSAKTTSNNAFYWAMTGNSVTLTPGAWKISCAIHFASSGGNPGYTEIFGFWGTANGADSAAVPTALTVEAGWQDQFGRWSQLNAASNAYSFGEVRARITAATQAVFCDPFANAANVNGRITTRIWAERFE